MLQPELGNNCWVGQKKLLVAAVGVVAAVVVAVEVAGRVPLLGGVEAGSKRHQEVDHGGQQERVDQGVGRGRKWSGEVDMPAEDMKMMAKGGQ